MSNNEILKKNNEKAENFDEIKKSSKPTGIIVIVKPIIIEFLAPSISCPNIERPPESEPSQNPSFIGMAYLSRRLIFIISS